MPFSGLMGRVAYALLAGIIVFIAFFIIGVIATRFDATIGNKLEEFSPIIGLLAGLVVFFTRPTPPVV